MQTLHISRALPTEIRWLLAAAGWLLPPALRTDWLREWRAEFWHCRQRERNTRRQMRARAFGAFPDAWFLLRQDYGIARRILDAAHSRSALVVLLVLLLAATALGTHGFRAGRNLLFHDDPAGLVLVFQPGPFMGGAARIPAAQADAWLQSSQTVKKLGRWSMDHLVCHADAAALALLAQAPVKPLCGRFEPLVSSVAVFAGVVAQLKSGASIDQAEQELAQTTSLHKGWMQPGIVTLAAVRKAPLMPVGSVLFGLMLLSILAVRANTVRAWMWALSKIGLSFALIAGIWIEFVARAPFTEAARVPAAWGVLLYVLPAFAGSGAAWWFRRAARRHCRVCYRPLSMPVFVGMSGRRLFEPGGTEYLCGEGHGALLVAAEPMGGEAWATWSDTWA